MLAKPSVRTDSNTAVWLMGAYRSEGWGSAARQSALSQGELYAGTRKS